MIVVGVLVVVLFCVCTYIGSCDECPRSSAVGGVVDGPSLAHGDDADAVDCCYRIQLHLRGRVERMC